MATDLAVSETLELWSAKKVASHLGWTERAVWRYARLGNVLPRPIPVEGSAWTYVWLADDIRKFAKGR